MDPIANVSAAFKSPDYREQFILTMRIAMQQARASAESHGFKTGDREDGTLLMLMTSELGECLEALRHGNKASEHIPAFSGAEEELADLLIRVFDYAESRCMRLPEAILCKMDFNATREFRHSKAF